MASVLAVAGLVVFATEASAHNNFFESVSGACNAPGTGAGATLSWTIYNDWAQTETGTYSTAQGVLSTTALSIAASPTNNATPPAAASQSFTQTLSAAELAALSPSSTISVGWSATWADGTAVSGTLTTSVAALDLTNGCVTAPTTPTISTTLAPPSSTGVGNSWGDSATVTGSPGGAPPAGSVSFYVCKASGASCSSGGSLQGTVGSPTSSSGNASTYTLGTPYTPTTTGTYCFYTLYTPSSGDPYLATWGAPECFDATLQYPGIMTTLVPPSSSTVGNAWSDTATVNGEFGAGTPLGSVSFYVCKVSTSPTSTSTCTDPTGTLVGTVSTPSSTSGVSATYDLSPTTYTPTDVGTYCFYTLYEPSGAAAGTYYPVWGPAECFGVVPRGTTTTTHTSESVIVIGGTAHDTATVADTTGSGAPTGTVTFYSCEATGTTGCTGGTVVPGTPNPATLTPVSGTDTSTASSPSITPTATGTYCFGAVYTPDSTKYAGSSDNMGDTVDTSECFTVGPAAPSITTTLVPPTSTSVGNAWSDSATVSGNAAGGPPAGSMGFYVCAVAAGASSCTSGGTLVGTVASPSTTSGSDSIYNLAPTTFTPPAVGTYCFYTSYTPATVDNYSAAGGPAECFTVTPATPTIATTVAAPTSTTVGNAWSDSATVTGNSTGGSPAGSMTFSVCKVASGNTVCSTGGTMVGTVASPTSTSGDVSTYNLAPTTYTPPSAGTYCFYTTYAPATVDNYASASGPAECFVVSAVTTAATVTPTGTSSSPTTTPTTSPTTSPSTTPAIAFTGALLSQEWLIGLGALVLGTALVLVARWRRRLPKHAAK